MFFDIETLSGGGGQAENSDVVWSDYFFPHEMTNRQKEALDLNEFTAALSDKFPIQNIQAGWSELRGKEILSIHFESADFLDKGSKTDLVTFMNSYVEEHLPEHLRHEKREPAPTEAKTSYEKGAVPERGYQIYYGDTAISVPIADENRAALGYNLLSAMAENNTSFSIWPDTTEPFDKDQLHLMGADGHDVTVKPDPEWFGTEAENQQVKEAVLDQYMEECASEGLNLDRAFEAKLQDQYTICSDDNGFRLRFAPMTWDMDKAQEMQNFLRYGLDSNVSLSIENKRGIRKMITSDQTYIINRDGDVYCDGYNKNWAVEQMPQLQTLSEALDSLSAMDPGLALSFN